TLLSSQGTDASFGAESTAPSGRFVSFFAFVFQRFFRFAFAFPA
ncbi:hypothetical protein ABIA38_003204, partial [Embleya sp. AB8]